MENNPILGAGNVNTLLPLETRLLPVRWCFALLLVGLVLLATHNVPWYAALFTVVVIGYTALVHWHVSHSDRFNSAIPLADMIITLSGLTLVNQLFIPYVVMTIVIMATVSVRSSVVQLRLMKFILAFLFSVILYIAYGSFDQIYIILVLLGMLSLTVGRFLKNNTSSISERDAKLQGLLTLTPSGMIIVDEYKMYTNARLYHILGRQPPTKNDQYFVYSRGSEPHFVRLLWLAVQEQIRDMANAPTTTTEFEKSVEIESGDIRTISFSHKRELLKSNDIIDVMNIRDMTVLRQRAEQRHGRERLQILGTVTSMAIHEIRNPLAAMRAKVQLMASHHDLQFIQKQANGLVHMIDDINEFCERLLAVGRVSKRKKQQFEVAQFLHDVLAIMGPLAKRSKVIFKVEDVAAGTWVVGDALALRHVLINLIQNGIEALQQGGRLTIRTDVQERSVVFSVEDNGGGIPKHIAARLFEPFYTTKKRGTGLGLVISQQIVEENNGKLYFRSTEHGTIFYCSLPRVVTEEMKTQTS